MGVTHANELCPKDALDTCRYEEHQTIFGRFINMTEMLVQFGLCEY